MRIHCEVLERKPIRFASEFVGAVVALCLSVPNAWAQTTEHAPEKPATAPMSRVDTSPDATFYLKNITSVNEANEIVIAIRNMLDPSAKVYLAPSQNAIVMRSTSEQIALAQKIVNELDRPKKAYRLTYSITEIDSGKRVGVQHFSMVVTEGQRAVMKQGSKVPIVTGSYNNGTTGNGPQGVESQVTFIDVGMNFDATVDPYANGVRLKSKVEQLGIAEEKSGVGPQDPIVRQTAVEGTAFLTAGKPVVLGSLDIPGSTRHLDVDVMIEPLGQ
jgi:type II secretory pathway component GspD/PulD (secretin)